MDKINIIDNFLDEKELNKLLFILNNKSWIYPHSSGKQYEIISSKFFASYNLESFITEYMKEKFELLLNKQFKLNRMYMHTQTYGQDGAYHTDDIGDNKYTFCLYINDIHENNIYNSGGEFLIKIPNEKYILCIEPKNNRGVFFPSYYIHKGDAYTRFINNKRICLTWKLELI